MLQNGLGELILNQADNYARFVDLFCGGSSVAWYAAESTNLPVLAIDLQNYAVSMAQAVLSRTYPVDPDELASDWLSSALNHRNKSGKYHEALRLEANVDNIPAFVSSARELCQDSSRIGPIWNAYGGHYFSPGQAISIDYMLKYLPSEEPERSICIAATIICASQCAAAPGHTAQPFQPTDGASPFLMEAWRKSPGDIALRVLPDLCSRHANAAGEAKVQDATEAAATLNSSDLVIVDPPYSGVQYSRFYHVLEAVSNGSVEPVSGVGRYPALCHRPQSSFSNKGQSINALSALLETLSNSGATVIFTFPAGESSNGLSGKFILSEARKRFVVEIEYVAGTFSTLGGNNQIRSARNKSREMILLLKPKVRTRK